MDNKVAGKLRSYPQEAAVVIVVVVLVVLVLVLVVAISVADSETPVVAITNQLLAVVAMVIEVA